MRRRTVLASLAAGLAAVPGCLDGTALGRGDLPTPVTESTVTRTRADSPTATDGDPGGTAPPVPEADCSAAARPTPATPGEYDDVDPPAFPERPADLGGAGAAVAYVTGYEQAYAVTTLLAEGDPPEGTAYEAVEASLERYSAEAAGDGYVVTVGVRTTVGYDASAPPNPTEGTPTPLPSVQDSHVVDYYVTERRLWRGPERSGEEETDWSAATLLECWAR